MMKWIFDGIKSVIGNPMYLFDVLVVLYWLPRLEIIIKTTLKVLKHFARIFWPT